MEDYKGFKFWLASPTGAEQPLWRIKFPGGHKTPALSLQDASAVRAEIDKIILDQGV